MSRMTRFLEELDELSRKHGVWIQCDFADVELVDEDYNVIAVGLHCDQDTQEYLVREEYRDCIE